MDKIANTITKISNSFKAKYKTVDIIKTKLNANIANFLIENKVFSSIKEIDNKILCYFDADLTKLHLTRISKPGRRTYFKISELNKILKNPSILLVSTSKGFMSNSQAVKNKSGGEILFKIDF